MKQTFVRRQRNLQSVLALVLPPPFRTIAGTLLIVYAAIALAAPKLVHAETEASTASFNLVYIAESSNQRLNHRLGKLLSEAFGESMAFRSFVPGQTAQDSVSPVIAIGPDAFSRVQQENNQVPVLGLLVDEAFLSANDTESHAKSSAVLSRPLLIRQAATGKAILPYATRVAMLARPETEHLYQSVLEELPALGMEGRVFLVASEDRLIPTLIRALSYGDFLLAASDSSIYNPRTIKHILLTAYRRNRIVIGPTQAYVKAGSLASSYTPLRAVAELASDYIHHYQLHGKFPEPAHPADFGIEINRQVGRSLNIPIPEGPVLKETVKQRLDSLEVRDE